MGQPPRLSPAPFLKRKQGDGQFSPWGVKNHQTVSVCNPVPHRSASGAGCSRPSPTLVLGACCCFTQLGLETGWRPCPEGVGEPGSAQSSLLKGQRLCGVRSSLLYPSHSSNGTLRPLPPKPTKNNQIIISFLASNHWGTHTGQKHLSTPQLSRTLCCPNLKLLRGRTAYSEKCILCKQPGVPPSARIPGGGVGAGQRISPWHSCQQGGTVLFGTKRATLTIPGRCDLSGEVTVSLDKSRAFCS